MAKFSSCFGRYCSYRWRLCYICSIAVLLLQIMRVNLSMAFVCMLKTPNRTANNVNSTQSSQQCSGLLTHNHSSHETYNGEFTWSNNLQANILAGYFYGYILTNILGGILADKYGTRNILGFSLVSASVLTLLQPSLSRISGYFTLVLRILTGLVSGPMFPSIQSLFGRWAPPLESSALLGLIFSGQLIGSIVCFSISGFLCVYGFDNGWGSIFYIFGGMSLLFSSAWFYFVYDSPELHPSLSQEERSYLDKTVMCKSKVKNIPWKNIWSSSAVWAIIVAHTCYNWTDLSLALVLPLYMKEALNVETKSNGLMSSAPWIGQAISMPLLGRLADFIRSKNCLSTRSVRVLFQTMCFIFSAILFSSVGFLKCDQASLVGFLFLFSGVMLSLYIGGFNVNHVDIAPKYAGVLYGITNTFSSLPGFVAPITARELTPNGTQKEWQIVLSLCAGFSVLGAIVYAIMAKGEIQEWAKYDDSSIHERESLNLKERRATNGDCEKI
ncbi:sialin isoform X1 [Octopus bimaculoides]|uniref:Major facilitator superfamily (MFS) profile domain-containing protein n=1 Tax=Octopus bimaculoides TaxID=37653 RepID=A0A0L8HST4_OCTBM|nr:sialin isoform X1 [Octopus bimaculoides]